jgi:hypothetical protein
MKNQTGYADILSEYLATTYIPNTGRHPATDTMALINTKSSGRE